MNPSHKTAVLVFANSSKEELLHKPIFKGKLLFNSLTKETIKKVERTGLPYFHFTEQEQKGNSFGERYTHAIQSVFDLGFNNIITIGNDTPQLSTQHLLETQKALQDGKTVLGPALDGGFYLMGLHKSDFDATIFKRLPWQRFSLLKRMSDVLQNTNCSVFNLPTLSDIDNLQDVKRLASFRKSISSIVLLVFSILLKLENSIAEIFVQRFLAFSLQKPHNKGSPLVLYS